MARHKQPRPEDPNPHGVDERQIWQSSDPREIQPKFKVQRIEGLYAVVTRLDGSRERRILLTRFKPNSTGYRKVSDG